jgi:hypothetical protein
LSALIFAVLCVNVCVVLNTCSRAVNRQPGDRPGDFKAGPTARTNCCSTRRACIYERIYVLRNFLEQLPRFHSSHI